MDLFTHKMIIIANANRICSSTNNIKPSVCLPIQLIKPSRPKHSIVMNIAPKNNNVTHSTCCKTESSRQLQKMFIFHYFTFTIHDKFLLCYNQQ